jgi:hypothetical protein
MICDRLLACDRRRAVKQCHWRGTSGDRDSHPQGQPARHRYVLEGTYMRRYEAPLRSRIDPEANCACREAR